MRRLGLSLVLLSAAFLLLPTGTQAQVVVDPDSPAGKEYAIPLEQKRDQAVGGKDQSRSNPFGEGISKPGASAAKKSGSGESGGKKDREKDDFDATGAVAGSDSSGGGGGGSGGGPDEAGTSGALLTSGIALAVLLLGGGIAFLMRRGAFGTDA